MCNKNYLAGICAIGLTVLISFVSLGGCSGEARESEPNRAVSTSPEAVLRFDKRVQVVGSDSEAMMVRGLEFMLSQRTDTPIELRLEQSSGGTRKLKFRRVLSEVEFSKLCNLEDAHLACVHSVASSKDSISGPEGNGGAMACGGDTVGQNAPLAVYSWHTAPYWVSSDDGLSELLAFRARVIRESRNWSGYTQESHRVRHIRIVESLPIYRFHYDDPQSELISVVVSCSDEGISASIKFTDQQGSLFVNSINKAKVRRIELVLDGWAIASASLPITMRLLDNTFEITFRGNDYLSGYSVLGLLKSLGLAEIDIQSS